MVINRNSMAKSSLKKAQTPTPPKRHEGSPSVRIANTPSDHRPRTENDSQENFFSRRQIKPPESILKKSQEILPNINQSQKSLKSTRNISFNDITEIRHSDNDHHLQLKISFNNLTDIKGNTDVD